MSKADTVADSFGGSKKRSVANAELKKDAVGLPGVLMQSITSIAPGIAGLFTVPFIVANAGVDAPLAYLAAFIIALFLGYSLMQFSKHLSSTGSYYTFVSRSLGPRTGFLVAWVYLLFYPICVSQVGSFMGNTLQTVLKAEYGWNFQWWWFVVFLIAVVAITAWRGLELSTKLIITMGSLEILIVLALAISGFLHPGSGGVNLHWLNPANAPSTHGLFLGVVFAIFAMIGWDAAAALAEESRNPKKTIPRAVLGSMLILGVFLVLVSWGQTSGWGTNHLASFGTSHTLPAFVLGKRLWGAGWILVLLALLNSAIASGIVCTNAATRFLYGMARAGALPNGLTKIHPRLKTPSNAIFTQTGINIAIGLILPLVIGVGNVFNLTGTWFTFAIAFVYVTANVGLYVFYRREHPDEFSWFKHFVVPALGSLALLIVVYYSVVPLPSWPVSLAPFIVVGWLAIGGVVLSVIYRGNRAVKLSKSGQMLGEAVADSIAERFEIPEPVVPPSEIR